MRSMIKVHFAKDMFVKSIQNDKLLDSTKVRKWNKVTRTFNDVMDIGHERSGFSSGSVVSLNTGIQNWCIRTDEEILEEIIRVAIGIALLGATAIAATSVASLAAGTAGLGSLASGTAGLGSAAAGFTDQCLGPLICRGLNGDCCILESIRGRLQCPC